jgi:radical SAM superfamily enzyme YgiQ (UPF0313 family)
MNVLLAYQSGLPHRNDPYISLVPTGLCYLHACLRKAGYDSLLANFSAWSIAEIKQQLLTFSPDIIGISQWTHNRHTSMDLARICRDTLPDSTIVMGGGHATFCYEDILVENSPVNLVILGEAELTLLELIERVGSRGEWLKIAGLAFRSNGAIVVTPPRNKIADLDSLPLPAHFLHSSVGLDLALQAEFIVTTRGCPSACHFCSSPDFWGRSVRFRSPAAIVTEIQYIRQQYGVIYFSLRDDTFTADRKRVLEFCSLLQKADLNILWNCQSRVTAIDEELLIAMKRAGCECIQLGIESGSAHILQQLGKRITPTQIKQACNLVREIGINLSIYLISDIPGETDDDIRQTIELIRQINPNDGYVSPLAYYPGTKLYNDAVSTGKTSPTIFSDSRKAALYVAPLTRTSPSRLLRELAKSRQEDSGRFRRQKERLGYCYTTNVIAGEWHRQSGEYAKAENELMEITVMQPNNPWGWLLLGDLYVELGKTKKGKELHAKVLEIVPQHATSK